MEIDLEALLQIFLTESEEGLVAFEEGVITLESRPDDGETLGEIFRVVHTLKGDASILGINSIAEVAHKLEDLLDRIRDGRMEVDGGVATLLLHSVDVLRGLLARAEEGSEETGPDQPVLLHLLTAALERRPEPAPARSEVTEAAGGELSLLSDQHVKSLRVRIDKLDELLDLTGEIGVARGQLSQALGERQLSPAQLLEAHRDADHLHRALQELVMKLRMVPVGPSFRRHVRTVRDLAQANGKQARLVLEGTDVELDTAMIEHLRDPLTHMIRNALDHGIETPEVRRARGKKEQGVILLRASYRAGGIVIELSDDGAGLRRDRIRARARSLGSAPAGPQEAQAPQPPGSANPASAASLTTAALDYLIFEPGFSTADDVTTLSGRGVGMDVVRRNVEALRGTVRVESTAGRGTKFTLRLPLTLAVIEGFRVGLGSEAYVLPLDSVVESLELPASERHGHPRQSGVIDVRGETLPYLRLRHLLNVDAPAAGRENVVVVRHEGGAVGLVVDSIHGQSQAIIKPLGRFLEGLDGITGSTILGDGQVALILDVPGLLARNVGRAPLESAASS